MSVRFELITPTHDLKYFPELTQSVATQTYRNFGWTIVVNGSVEEADVESIIRNTFGSTEVALIMSLPGCLQTKTPSIGAIKRFAFDTAVASPYTDYLVELDHDDILAPNCLEVIAEELGSSRPGFVYSDSVHFYDNGFSFSFAKEAGWESYVEDGNVVTKAFPCNPLSLQHIYYAPNHIRMWQRKHYVDIGGHDPSLPAADDHDLMVRSYLSGAEMRHIQRGLYHYREHNMDSANSYRSMSKHVVENTHRLGQLYIEKLIEEWCRREGLRKIDMGGAHNRVPKFEALDRYPPADIVHECLVDGEFKLPFEDKSVGVFRVFDFMEHIPQGYPIISMMNEFYRCLAHQGWLITMTPCSDGRGAFQDPTHVSFWNPNSFWYYTQKEFAKYVPQIRCRFAANYVGVEYPSEWHQENHIPYVRANLVACHEDNLPGGIRI
jgi:hypothetical protein